MLHFRNFWYWSALIGLMRDPSYAAREVSDQWQWWSQHSQNVLPQESEEYPDNAPSCGRIMSSVEFKIEKRQTSDRRYTKYMEFPWMVALYICWFFRCGGSLIIPKVVLVTGDCVYDYKQDKLKVRAGDWNLDTLEELLPYQEQFVNKIIFHPQFHDAATGDLIKSNDVALLVMESPYTLADNIGFICLPPPNVNVAPTSCKVAGWGDNIVMETGYNKLLKVMDLNYVDHDQCQRIITQNDDFSSIVLHDSFTCAGGVLDQAGCQGDGGSPLMCIADDHYYAYGLGSWNFNFCISNLPEVYTDVVKVRSWIDQEMRANGFTTDTYTPVAYRK